MARICTIPFRITPQREAVLRRELNIPADQEVRHVHLYYAIRDTVYAWLDEAGEADLTAVAAIEEDAPQQDAIRVSTRPYASKKKMVIRRKPR